MVCNHCGSPTPNFYKSNHPLERANREIRESIKARTRIAENGSVLCKRCSTVFYDGARKCQNCNVQIAYVGGSFFDNWPCLISATSAAFAPYAISTGNISVFTVSLFISLIFVIFRLFITKIRCKNKVVIRRSTDFELWMLAYLIPALILAYSLADIRIAYQ